MKFVVSSATHPLVVTRQVGPADFSDETNPGTEINMVEGSFGQAVFQEIVTGPFVTMHDFYAIREKCSLAFKADVPVLQVLLCLQGDVHFVIAGIGTVHLKQGQFLLLYVPLLDAAAIFDQPAELLMFNLHFPAEAIRKLLPLFPIQAFMDEIDISRAALLFPQPGWVTNEIITAITVLLGFIPMETEKVREYFFEIKVQQLLVLFLLQKFYKGNAVLSETAMESVRHARHIMESNIGRIPGLAEIAHLMGVEMGQLKNDFKAMMGISMTVFLLRARLNNAKLLILETDLPISEVATISGYARPEDFNQAFKRNFDYTPLSLRKDKL